MIIPEFEESTRDMFATLQEAYPKARGSFLAEIDLKYRKIAKNDKNLGKELSLDLDDLFVRYFDSFGHAYCLFEDLKPYLNSCCDPANIISQIEKGLPEEKNAATVYPNINN
jgi:hypothetical protein